MPGHHLVARLQGMTAEELRRQVFRWPGGSLSLGELRDRMLRLAHWLKEEAAVRPGDRVAICLPKSPEALVAMYGIMASGAAYVPLQFAGPPERLTRILASVEPRLLLTTAAMAERLGAEALAPLLKVEPSEDGAGLEAMLAAPGRQSAIADVRPDDVSWVIFTSGSTGEPKGVMLSHRNMATNMDWMLRRDRMTEARPQDQPCSTSLHRVLRPAVSDGERGPDVPSRRARGDVPRPRRRGDGAGARDAMVVERDGSQAPGRARRAGAPRPRRHAADVLLWRADADRGPASAHGGPARH